MRVSVLFRSPPGVLCTFPHQVYAFIGHISVSPWRVVPSFHSFSCPMCTRIYSIHSLRLYSLIRPSSFLPNFTHAFDSSPQPQLVSIPGLGSTRSLAATEGISVDSPFPQLLRCFQFTGCRFSWGMSDPLLLPGFHSGDLRVKVTPLTLTYRSCQIRRLIWQGIAVRPYLLDYFYVSRHAGCRDEQIQGSVKNLF